MKPQRLSINAGIKLGNLILDGLITLVVVSYFVGRLGPQAYGLVPWLTSLFIFLTIIPTAVQTAAGRFVTHALGRKDAPEAEQYYVTTSLLLFGLGLAGVVLTVVLAWLGAAIFPFAPKFIPMARALTLLFGATVSLDIARSAFAVGYFARERFDLEYGVMIVGGFLRLGIIIGLSETLGVSLIWIGVGALAGAIWRTAGGLFFIRRLLPELTLSLGRFSRHLLRPISVFALEVMTAGVGLVILQQADILVAGWLLGPAMVTVYFCGARWSFFLRAVIGSLTTVLVPRVTTLQAEKKMDDVRKLTRQADRLVMPLGWLLAGLLWAFARPLIYTWVGPEQKLAVDVLHVLAFPLAITVSSYVALSVLTGIGKIRESSLSALVIGLLNPVLSILLIVQFDLGVVGIALATVACLLARNGVYIPVLLRRHVGQRLWDYYREQLWAALAALPSVAAGYFIVQNWTILGWVKLIVAGILCALPSLILIYFIIWQPGDRRLFKKLLPLSAQSTTEETRTE